MQVASAMQFELRPEDEGVLAAIPTKDLIEELVELQSRVTIVGKALGDELNRTQTVVVPKLKAELEESANSLKSAIEMTETCREEMQKKDRLAKEEQEALKLTLAKVMVEQDKLLKEKVDVEAKGESLAAEMEKFQELCCILMRKVSTKAFGRQFSFMAYRPRTQGMTWGKCGEWPTSAARGKCRPHNGRYPTVRSKPTRSIDGGKYIN